MTKRKINEIQDYLEKKELLDDKLKTLIGQLRDSIPGMTYNIAVIFLGLIAVVLVVGCCMLLLQEKEISEGMWGLGGAAIGGLAGIFAGNK